MRTAQLDSRTLTYNHASLKNALRELECDFMDGHKEFVMQCIFPDCTGHKRPFYLNCDLRAGQWHCFRCDRTGFFDEFVRMVTGWGVIRVAVFAAKHQAYSDPNDTVDRAFQVQDVNDELLAKFGKRHAYVYDRGLTEPTLTRYRVGYDVETHAITFPWYDRTGKLIAVKLRSILTKQYRFISSGSYTSLLYGLHLVRPRSIVWLTEGEFDAMWLDQCFRQYNLTEHAAVAMGGKYLYPQAKEELLVKVPKLVVLATDNDDDGSEAADRIAFELNGTPTHRMTYPVGCKDPNETDCASIVKQLPHIETALQLCASEYEKRYQLWQERRNTCHD